MGHQKGHRHRVEHRAGRAAQDKFLPARMPIGAHHDQVDGVGSHMREQGIADGPLMAAIDRIDLGINTMACQDRDDLGGANAAVMRAVSGRVHRHDDHAACLLEQGERIVDGSCRLAAAVPRNHDVLADDRKAPRVGNQQDRTAGPEHQMFGKPVGHIGLGVARVVLARDDEIIPSPTLNELIQFRRSMRFHTSRPLAVTRRARPLVWYACGSRLSYRQCACVTATKSLVWWRDPINVLALMLRTDAMPRHQLANTLLAYAHAACNESLHMRGQPYSPLTCA